MIIRFNCPGCKKQFDVDGAYAGKRSRCRTCGAEFRIPAPKPGPDGPAVPHSNAPAAPAQRQSPSVRPAAREAVPIAIPEPILEEPAWSNNGAMDDLFDEGAVAPAATRAEALEDEEDGGPPSPRRSSYESKPKSKPKSKKKKNRGKSSRDEIEASDNRVFVLSMFLLGDAVLTMLLTAYLFWGGGQVKGRVAFSQTGFQILALVSLGMSLFGAISLAITAFREETVKGFLYLFLPFYAFVFVAQRWDRCRGNFGLAVAPFANTLVQYIVAFGVGLVAGATGGQNAQNVAREIRTSFIERPAPPVSGVLPRSWQDRVS